MSVAIPTFNAASYLEAAVHSALRQTLKSIEVIIVDDCSTDTTLQLANRLQLLDHRIKIDRLPRNCGPAAARNRALSMARGRWFAVLDSDDILSPTRLSTLVAVAEREGADIVADNLVTFGEGETPRLFLARGRPAGWLSPLEYLEQTIIYGNGANLGYLKPVLRLERLRACGIVYDERLRIAEDDDFVVRALLAGLRYWLEPSPSYGYRRHIASTSHRLSLENATAMVAAGERHSATGASHCPPVRVALARRLVGLRKAKAFAAFVATLKARRVGAAAAIAIVEPSLIGLLHMPLGAALGRLRPAWLPRRPPSVDPAAGAALLALDPVVRGHD